MKRLAFSILTILALTAGVANAQGPNTIPPGPTQQQEPGLTNNNLPNPGNPQTQTGNQNQPLQEEGTVEGTATESMNNADQSNTTGPVTGTTGTTTGTGTTGSMTGSSALQNEPEEGMDVDVDTGANAAGAVDVDVNSTSDADTDASGIDETGSLDQESTTTGYESDSDSLPATGSKLPLLGLLGMLALGAAFIVRRF